MEVEDRTLFFDPEVFFPPGCFGLAVVACPLPLESIPEEDGSDFDGSAFAAYACKRAFLRFFTSAPNIRFLLEGCNPTMAGFPV